MRTDVRINWSDNWRRSGISWQYLQQCLAL